MAAGGAAMATYKATEGTGYVDPTFAYNHAATAAAGLVSGPYHFLRRESSGAAQADHYLDVVGDLTGRLAQLDVETSGTGTNPTVQQARDFVARFHARTNGHPIMIYLPKWWYDQCGGGADLSGLGPLWASHYVTTRTGSAQEQYARASSSWATAGYAGWSAPTLLQFTDQSTIGGVPVMDADVFLGKVDDLRSLCYPPDLQLSAYTEDDDMSRPADIRLEAKPGAYDFMTLDGPVAGVAQVDNINAGCDRCEVWIRVAVLNGVDQWDVYEGDKPTDQGGYLKVSGNRYGQSVLALKTPLKACGINFEVAHVFEVVRDPATGTYSRGAELPDGAPAAVKIKASKFA